MPRPHRVLFPRTQARARALGQRLRLARLRRRMPLAVLAARVNSSRGTVARLEKGDLTVSVAVLAGVLNALGLEADLDAVAREDELGQRIQDVKLERARAPVRKTPRG